MVSPPLDEALPRLWRPNETPNKAAPILLRRRAVDDLVEHGLPYSKKLERHTSCVNAMAISPNGRWLASGGDDPYVHLWDFDQESLAKPSRRFIGPKSNVFTLAFSASGQYLYSGETRADIFQYDLSHVSLPIVNISGASESPCATHNVHDDSIRAISCHPEQDHLFLSAAEDGRVIQHDIRADGRRSRAQGMLQQIAPFSCVQYHPRMTQLFVTSDTQGVVCLRDVRMAFGSLSQRQNKGIVQKVGSHASVSVTTNIAQYVTAIAKQGQACMARPETSSLVFDREGHRLALTMLHHYPTLYSLNDPYPIATFSGRHLPDGSPVPEGERTWSNSCTMKHASFGGFGSDRDSYFALGSDDFRAYLWKIPEDAALLEGRTVVEHSEWERRPRPGEIGYAESHMAPRYVPVELSIPHARLTGHDSIVNTALIHPDRPYLLTAGIERYIRLHSPTPVTPCTEPLSLTPQEVRKIPPADPNSRLLLLRAMGIIDDPVENHEDDGQAIALFDQILRTEGNGDVFNIRPCGPGYELSDSEDDSDVEMDDEDADGAIDIE
ncbi:WD40 repeat-like protein [Pilatotrama ljubarskyi]|nr:WD40 repeat-like protein [Pilatotrama ljubarskyi]